MRPEWRGRRIFTDARLWYDAIDAYNELIERFPERANSTNAVGRFMHNSPARSRLPRKISRERKKREEKK